MCIIYKYMYLIQFCTFFFVEEPSCILLNYFYYFDYTNFRNYLKNLSRYLVKGVFRYFFREDRDIELKSRLVIFEFWYTKAIA